MANTIVLKDSENNDVTYSLTGFDGKVATYRASGAILLGDSQLTFRITRKPTVNRIVAKLSIPSVCTDPCGKQTVQYTEVGSLDLSSVLAADQAARDNFVAQFASLAASAAVADMYTDGIMPQV